MTTDNSEDDLLEDAPSADERTRSGKSTQNKTVRACETCRSQKARCVPSSTAGKCEKCVQLNKPCVQHVPKKRARTSKRSLARVEQKIENIYQLLEGRTVGQANITPSTDAQVSNNQYGIRHNILQKSKSPPTLLATDSQRSRFGSSYLPPTPQHMSPQNRQAPTPVSNTDQSNDRLTAAAFLGLAESAELGSEFSALGGHLLRKLGTTTESFEQLSKPLKSLEVALALKLMATFRTMMPYFPFITLPCDLSLDQLIEERPMSVLASLTVSSRADEELHTSCNYCFRQTLAKKVIVDGDRSLDLLQSMMIYLAWYHHYFDPGSQNIYQYLSLACSMAIDLGLHRRTINHHMYDGQLCGQDFEARPATPERDDTRVLEGERAIIGCYYLSCVLSVLGMSKHRNMEFSDHLRHCGVDLAKKAYYPSDKALLPCAELLHIADDVRESMREDLPTNVLSVVDEVRLKASLKRAEVQLQHWREQYLPEAQDYWDFNLTYNFVEMYVYESALSINALQDQAQPTSSVTCSHIQLSMLISAVQATKKLLDDLFAKPSNVFSYMAMPEWTHLIAAVILMAKLSRPLPSIVGWDVGEVRAIVRVEQYIDRLVACLEVEGHMDGMCHDLFCWFKAVCQNIKRWVVVANQPQSNQDMGTRLLPDRRSTAETLEQFNPYDAHKKQPTMAQEDSLAEESRLAPSDRGSAVAFPTQSSWGPDISSGLANPGFNPSMDVDDMWNDFILNWPQTFWGNGATGVR